MFPVYPALWARPEYREPAEELLAVCAERDIGVMAIKAVARRPWADRRPLADAVAGSPATAERWAASWYEPQATDEEIDRGVHFALVDAGRPRVLHARRHRACCRGCWRRPSAPRRWATPTRRAAVEAMAAEELIFPMPRCRGGPLRPPAAPR